MAVHPSVDLLLAMAAQLAQQCPFAPLPLAFPPGPPYDLALPLAHHPLHCFQHLKSHYGPAVGFKLASQPVVLVSSPKLTREILVTKSNVFVKSGTAFFPGSSLTGNGLLVSDGEVWLRQRRLSNPAFRKCVIASYAQDGIEYMQAIVDLASEMVEEKWQKRCVRNVYGDFNDLTMQVVATTLFGGFSGTHSLDAIGPAITTAFKLFTDRATSMFIVPEWFPSPDNIQYNIAVKKLDDVVYNVIRERRAFLASDCVSSKKNSGKDFHENSKGFQDLLTQLIMAKDDDFSGMSDRLLRDELMTLLVAGQETSAILLAWSMSMLALYPQLQQRLYLEIESVLEGRKPTYVDLSKMCYMEAFILETMRLMPPAYIIGRCANQKTNLGEWVIPKGTTILIGIYLLHRDPLYWSQPSDFNPSRWLKDGHIKRLEDNSSYWPFGGGPRTCIGSGFAMMEACLVLCIIVRKYKVSFPAGDPPSIKPRPMITLRPDDPLQLELVSRI